MDPKPLKIAPRSPQDLGPGAIIDGRYKVVAKIGVGGTGVVYDVEHTRTGRRLALKMLLDAEQAPRLEQEARATAKLRSRHVVRVVDLGNDRGNPYLVMTLLEGLSMRELLEERKKLDLRTTANIVLQLAECLDEAHTLGLIHRDLKPDNIHLSPVTRAPKSDLFDVTVLDFGVVKLLSENEEPSALTRTGSTVGTPYYMSLEQLRGSAQVDGLSDIYSLSVLLYEAFTGTVPFTAATLGDLVFAMISAPPIALHVVRPELPKAICDLVVAGISSKKEDRPKSMRAVAEAFMPHAEPAFSLWLRGGADVEGDTVDKRANEGPPKLPPRPPAGPPSRPIGLPKPEASAGGPVFGGAAAKQREAAAQNQAINVPSAVPIDAETTDDDPPTRAANVSSLVEKEAAIASKSEGSRPVRHDTPTEMFVKGVHTDKGPPPPTPSNPGGGQLPAARSPEEPAAFPTMNLEIPQNFGDATAVLEVPREVAQQANVAGNAPTMPANPSYAFVPPPAMGRGPEANASSTLVSPQFPQADPNAAQGYGQPPMPPMPPMVPIGDDGRPGAASMALPSQTFGQLVEQMLATFKAATGGQKAAIVGGAFALIAFVVMMLVLLVRR